MIDHVGLNVKDVAASRGFYEKALAALGYEALMSFPEAVGFGTDGKPFFWIVARSPHQGSAHVAFHCKDHKTVDAFHAAAVAAGGVDNGAPGPRPQYHPDYYGAFILDPDGNNVEAVCHGKAGA